MIQGTTMLPAALIVAAAILIGAIIVSQAFNDAIAAVNTKLDALIAKANTPPVADDSEQTAAVVALGDKIDAALAPVEPSA